MCIRIYVQDKFFDPRSPSRVFEDIGGLRGCKSLAPNQWGGGHLNQVKLLLRINWIFVNECNLLKI